MHHIEYGKFRLSHALSPLDATAEDSDDDDDDDDSDLLVPPFLLRHRTILRRSRTDVGRYQTLETMFSGGQLAVLAGTPARSPPPHDVCLSMISLASLHVRLQI